MSRLPRTLATPLPLQATLQSLSRRLFSAEPRPVLVLSLTLLTLLVGCASRAPAPAPELQPQMRVSAMTLRRIDLELLGASRDARTQSAEYARELMQRWRAQVYQHTEAEFIPWFSGYWTRQWLSMKVAWYRMNAEGGNREVEERLAEYLQSEFRERVLEPIAREIRPDWIMAQATLLYVRTLRDHSRDIARQYRVPAQQFAEHLQGIPAISLAPGQQATLYKMVNAEPIDTQPAYRALVASLNSPGGNAGLSSDTSLSALAHSTSEQLTRELATRSVAGALSAMVGSVAGAAISLVTVGFSAMANESRRPEMEAQLRRSLFSTFDATWLKLLQDPDSGVLSGVAHMTRQVEGALGSRIVQPLEAQPAALPSAPSTAPLAHKRFKAAG